MSTSAFVWCDSTGLGRNVFVIFRRTFTLGTEAARNVRSAELQLFADTRYRLWVNGQIVAYGPGRFVPKRPEYDRVDLRQWLKKGRNAIVVEANSWGVHNFNAMPSIGGVFARGTIRAGKTTVDLATPGDWKMQRATAWDEDAPSYSFAQPAAEIFDARKLPPGIREAKFDDSAWESPVPVARQDAWGTPVPRSVQMLTMDLHLPERTLVNGALSQEEQVIAARFPGKVPQGAGEKIQYCFATNIFSPTDQIVTLGSFWGPLYLNGQEIAPAKNPLLGSANVPWNVSTPLPPVSVPSWCNTRGNRVDYPVRLRQGWNFLYGEPQLLRELQGLMLGLPTGKGLIASVNQNPDGLQTTIFSEGVSVSVLEAAKNDRIPLSMEHLPKVSVPWHHIERGQIAPLPARYTGWDTPADRQPPAMPHTVENIRIPAETPWVLLFDLGCERLGHIGLDIEAPAGTILDVAYDERLRADGLVAIYQTNWAIDNADRFITAGGRQQIEGFHPRGCRYVQIAVRNAGGAAGPIVLHGVHYRQTILPMEVQGRFESSDPVLDWTWNVGRDTIRICLDTAMIADGWRESVMATYDAVPIYNALIAFASDPAVMARSLRLFADAQTPDGGIPAMCPAWYRTDAPNPWFVLLVGYYVRHTGDMALLRELWPNVVRTMAAPFELGAHGLGDVGSSHIFIDWGLSPDVHRGENFSPNAHYFGALQTAAELATMMKDAALAKKYRSAAAKLKRAFQNLWDEAGNRYAATLVDRKPLHEPVSPHANVLALYYGIADKNRIAPALACVEEWVGDEKFLAPGHLDMIYFYWTLEVLYRHGRFELAEHMMRRNFGTMKNHGAWTIWETLGRCLNGQMQLCQGWGASPLTMMAHYILGVRTAPGRPREVLVAPGSATLRFARGAVAHPDGPIEVDWRIHGDGPGEWLELSVHAPKSVKLTVEPQGPLAKLPLKFTRLHRPAGG